MKNLLKMINCNIFNLCDRFWILYQPNVPDLGSRLQMAVLRPVAQCIASIQCAAVAQSLPAPTKLAILQYMSSVA